MAYKSEIGCLRLLFRGGATNQVNVKSHQSIIAASNTSRLFQLLLCPHIGAGHTIHKTVLHFALLGDKGLSSEGRFAGNG